MAAEQGPMSGFRDMLADQMIPRQEMIETIQEVYEGYGFTPLKTPALERLETLQGKYGPEGEKLMYKFQDNGGRDVALRYDQTVPLARVVAQHRGRLPMPYKRYVVGEVWRGESPQAGRYREFTQFDADIVGASGPIADAEVVAMMSDSMTAFGVDSLIRVNNRRILDGLAQEAGVSSEQEGLQLIGTIDKVEKIGKAAVLSEVETSFGGSAAGLISRYLGLTGDSLEKLEELQGAIGGNEAVAEGTENLTEVFRLLLGAGYASEQIVFDQTIARGLDYYTGIIYETTLTEATDLGSVCSGGRYDNLIEALGGPSLPAVGTSIGVDRLYDGLQRLGKLETAQTTADVMITNFASEDAALYVKVATELRQAGIATEVHYEPRKLGKQFGVADKMGIPYVVVMGPEEVESGVAKVKTLKSGEETTLPLSELSDYIQALLQEKS